MSLDDKQHIRPEEYLAFLEWKDDNSLDGIENLIRVGDMSPAMRDIVADIFAEKLKRKSGAKSTIFRDIEIYGEVIDNLCEGIRLTSSRDKEGAAQLVADQRGMEESTVIKAYQRIGSKFKPMHKRFYELLLNDVEFWLKSYN